MAIDTLAEAAVAPQTDGPQIRLDFSFETPVENQTRRYIGDIINDFITSQTSDRQGTFLGVGNGELGGIWAGELMRRGIARSYLGIDASKMRLMEAKDYVENMTGQRHNSPVDFLEQPFEEAKLTAGAYTGVILDSPDPNSSLLDRSSIDKMLQALRPDASLFILASDTEPTQREAVDALCRSLVESGKASYTVGSNQHNVFGATLISHPMTTIYIIHPVGNTVIGERPLGKLDASIGERYLSEGFRMEYLSPLEEELFVGSTPRDYPDKQSVYRSMNTLSALLLAFKTGGNKKLGLAASVVIPQLVTTRGQLNTYRGENYLPFMLHFFGGALMHELDMQGIELKLKVPPVKTDGTVSLTRGWEICVFQNGKRITDSSGVKTVLSRLNGDNLPKPLQLDDYKNGRSSRRIRYVPEIVRI